MNRIRTTIASLRGNQIGISPSVDRFLDEHGDEQIIEFLISRNVTSPLIIGTLNVLSPSFKRKNNGNPLYHLIFYGGSLLHIQNALTELSIKKNLYLMSVPDFVMLSLNNAEAEAKNKNETEEFKKVLMLLSLQGFAEINQKSIVAEILVQQNVAAFLFSGAEYNGVSTKVRQPKKDGLIPALQIFRIAIVDFLKERE
jgi:hypothetical protein